MKKLKQIFCKHYDYEPIYRNSRPSKNLKKVEEYEVRVCKHCKKRFLIVLGMNMFKVIK